MSFVGGQNVHGMPSWDNALNQSTAGLHTDPNLASFASGSPYSVGNILEQESALGDLLASNGNVADEAGKSQSFQSDWQVLYY